MNTSSNVVSIHPYFKIHAGRMAEAKAYLPRFVERVATNETTCLNYDFSFCGDEMFCRESYEGAAGVLAHLANVGELLGELFKIADVVRLEIHGPAAELEKLKEPLAAFQPRYFVYEGGLR